MNTTEQWKPVVGFEGTYEGSSWGQVRSLDRILSNGRRRRGQILKPWPANPPYLYVSLRKNGRTYAHRVHRLVMMAFIGPPSTNQEVDHIIGI